MRHHITATAIFLVLLALFPSAAVEAASLGSAAKQRLQTGGAVILMRHAQTVPGTGDPPGYTLSDCATQRNLDERGKAQAAALRQAFRSAGVKIGKVFSSAWCRCVDTAKLIAPELQVEIKDELGSFFDVNDSNARAASTSKLKKLIADWSGPDNLLLVTHQVNITALTGAVPAQGAFLVIEPASGAVIAGP